jgi:hypothetical protein
MNSLPIFFAFLATNSWLGSLAPPISKIEDCNQENTVLNPSFTELEFDGFAINSFALLLKEKLGPVLLEDVCKLSYLVKFGRSM